MTLTIIFIISGSCAAFLLAAKRFEEKSRKSFIILSAISKGDHQVRELSHSATHMYDEFKGKVKFFMEKQAPMYTKSYLNKTSSKARELMDKYTTEIRGSKLLKKQDGISEFFQSLSSVEKGEGEIKQVNFDHYEEPVDEVI